MAGIIKSGEFLFVLLLLTGCAQTQNHIPEKGKVPRGGTFDFSRMNLTEKPTFIELQVLGTVAFLGDTCESVNEGVCKRKLKGLFPRDGFYAHCSLSPCHNFIRAEVGGKGKVWGKEDEILKLLGAIDTEEEAKLWIYINGFDVINDDSLRVVKSEGRFSISAAKTKGCPLVKRLHQIILGPDGKIEEMSDTVLETYNGCS